MSDLESLYREVILDHSKRRIGDRELTEFDAEQTERSPTCGDVITMRVHVHDERLAEVAWQGDGCSISMASASVFTELNAGRPLAEVRASIEEFRAMLRSRGAAEGDEELLGDGVAFAGVSKFPMRVKCALLGWVAAEAALAKVA